MKTRIEIALECVFCGHKCNTTIYDIITGCEPMCCKMHEIAYIMVLDCLY